jgi:G:T-mismatch repair DNA endonuclease (very short patch repair protein)
VPKLAANVERDRRVDAALCNDGWVVVRIWEHLDLDEAVDLVEHSVRAQ